MEPKMPEHLKGKVWIHQREVGIDGSILSFQAVSPGAALKAAGKEGKEQDRSGRSRCGINSARERFPGRARRG